MQTGLGWDLNLGPPELQQIVLATTPCCILILMAIICQAAPTVPSVNYISVEKCSIDDL